ncbi:trimeric intracellular cation channel family protein [Crenobacter sp. SG2305]|uniref:trimeric intracellular cation channel family protein n=1 Tax=Crenobacter oryzisoli TaxID=3056844 RepID=UPI0025AA77B5|nr:trimeric intracellular cation channel family protein [Crenobacter sp. SG2305]MDN0085720.1 trimeric intracellular cation channel family protein [Crenobacter sp. SG2305]
MSELLLFTLLDIAGTFVFALSGAVAAKQRNLDLFGIVTIAFTVACGGGLIRDLCIGVTPPASLSSWPYLMVSAIAAVVVIGAYRLVVRLKQPVLFFDALGLGLFAAAGAHKALLHVHSAEAAILLGMITGVGGGVMRDVLLNRVPLILQKEIYASAALLGATFEVVGELQNWSTQWVPWVAIGLCYGLRYLALQYHWNLPTFATAGDDVTPPSE